MVDFQKFTLSNGLRVLVHEDHKTPMACVNILYDVGARDEDPEQTGFAHLFEHLMFGGSLHIPNYDTPLQRVGGENNAFTSNDITNYYITLPSRNLETAFWLESDRMLSLAFSEESLQVQKQVVVEEFKQRYLNQPYGDVWLRLRPLAYKKHPYQWATIGKEIAHIEQADLNDVKTFFKRFYNPGNAIMVVAGNVQYQEVYDLANKWFGNIPIGPANNRMLVKEPVQEEERRLEVNEPVPLNSIYIAFHGPDRKSENYYAMDLISDVLSRGNSSRLLQNLVKNKPVFSEINAYVTGSIDANLFVVEGKPLPDVSLDDAERAIWDELDRFKNDGVVDTELEKVKNKIESTMVFAELSILDKAMNLAYFELLNGNADSYNKEVEKYLNVTADDIKKLANDIFQLKNSNTLIYRADDAK